MADVDGGAIISRVSLLREHLLPLTLTAGVAVLLVRVFVTITSKLRPEISANNRVGAGPGGKDLSTTLLCEYGRAWCLHQLVPFLDELLLGNYGHALDNRMLRPFQESPVDWCVRLPLALFALVFPSSPLLLFAAHLLNVISWASWMPAVWDHMIWAVLTEVTFLIACIFSAFDASKIPRIFYPAARAQLVVLYWSAAFWKLTSSWYAPQTSCAPVLLSELLSALFTPSVLPPGDLAANALLGIAPVFVAGLEFAVAGALMLVPEAGVMLALLFHQTINLMPLTYAGGFSIAMCTRFVLFLPGAITASMRVTGHLWFPMALVVAIGAQMFAIHRGLDAAGVAFLFLAFLYLRAILTGSPSQSPGDGSADRKKAEEGGDRSDADSLQQASPPGASRLLTTLAVSLSFLYGFASPILGLQAMNSSTMYSNLRQFGGGNHLIVPTGVLQDLFRPEVIAAASSTKALPPELSLLPSWVLDLGLDAFGGGMVRVDATDSAVMQELTPADATDQLPTFARDLLRGFNASGRYFELYAARNFFKRDKDLESSALRRASEGGKSSLVGVPFIPYAQPAYELRRVLALARERRENFTLAYTKLPYFGIPSSYRDYRGEQVILVETRSASSGEIISRKCSRRALGEAATGMGAGEGAAAKESSDVPCASDEIALLPPPPQWLLKLFHPYPVPLLEGDGREVHCST